MRFASVVFHPVAEPKHEPKTVEAEDPICPSTRASAWADRFVMSGFHFASNDPTPYPPSIIMFELALAHKMAAGWFAEQAERKGC